MSALERWQTAITGNLASGSVAGFKKDETSFSAATAGRTKLDAAEFGPSLMRLSPMANRKINDSQGNLRQSGKELDVAVQGAGYFQVRASSGDTAYTRNGEFHLDPSGMLVSGQGLPILAEGGTITMDPKLGPVTIDREGQVAQGETVVGKLALYDLSAAKQMQRSGDGLLVPEDGETPPRVAKPEVLQGYVEESNVAPLQEMVNLITVSRAYEVSQKLITSLDQTTRSAIETLGNP